MTNDNDEVLLKLCAEFISIDAKLIKNDQFSCGDDEEIINSQDALMSLIGILAELSPVTDEGAHAQALVLLSSLRHLEIYDASEDILRLMQRVVSRAAGVPEMGDTMQPFNSVLGPRFNLALKLMCLA